MRTYLTFHLLALIVVDQIFRHFTAPIGDDPLNPLMCMALVLACIGSVWILARLLCRGRGFRTRAIAFLSAWTVFYFLWSGGIVLAARVTINLLVKIYDEVFLLFANTSGMQFETWNLDSNFYFLFSTLPVLLVAAALSLAIHFAASRRTTPLQLPGRSNPQAPEPQSL